MDRNPVRIQEEIEAAREDFEASKLACLATYNRAKSANRDLTNLEASEFDHNAAVARAAKSRIDDLKNELEQAENNLRHTVMSLYPNAKTSADINRPAQVLPTNGRLPGEQGPRYNPTVRTARLKCFSDERAAYDSGMWLRCVVARELRNSVDPVAERFCESIGMQITNASYEGSGPAGGYLTPAPLSSAIIEVREMVGVARRTANVMPATSDSLSVPKKSGGLTVYYPNELQTITASDKDWSLISLAMRKRAVLSKISQELSDDALISIVDNVVSEQGYALALQEDNEYVNGDGGSSYGSVSGLLSAIGTAGVSTAATGHDTWAELDLADMAAVMGKLPDRFHVYNPSWICSHSFYVQVMARLAFAAAGATMAEVAGGVPGAKTFLGYPVFTTPHMPIATAAATKCALFGAFSQAAILADRGPVRFSRSDDWKFDEDVIALKTTSRYDIRIHEGGDSSSAGAYVALATAS